MTIRLTAALGRLVGSPLSWRYRISRHMLITALFALSCWATDLVRGPMSAYALVSPAFALVLIWGMDTITRWRTGGTLTPVIATLASILLVPPLLDALGAAEYASPTRGVAHILQIVIVWFIWTERGTVRASVDPRGLQRLFIGAFLGRVAVIPITQSAVEAIQHSEWMHLALSLGRGASTAFVFLALWVALTEVSPPLLATANPSKVALLVKSTVVLYALCYTVLPNFFIQLTVSIVAGMLLTRRGAAWFILFTVVLTGVGAIFSLGVFSGGDSSRITLVTYLYTMALVCIPLLLVQSREDKTRLVALSESRREAAQRQANLFATVFASSSDGVILVDGKGRVLRASPAAAQLTASLAGGPAALTGETLPDGSPNPLREVLIDGIPRSHDLTLPGAAGGPDRIVALRSYPLQSDEDMAVLVLQDVSPERQAAASVRQFAQMAAHDLRAPLTSMSLSAELAEHVLSDVPSSPVTEEVRGLLHDIVDRGEAAAVLLDDLVGFALVDRAEPALTSVDLGEVARSAVDSLGDLSTVVHGSDGLTVDTSEAGVVLADRRLVRRALANLLTNAVKYASPQRPPVVRISSTVGDDGWVTIAVEDNGIGVPEGTEDRVFEPFYRSPDHSGRVEGTGLGLSIVARVAAAHGGRARAVRLPQGTRFEMILPGPPQPVSPPSKPDAGSQRRPAASPVRPTAGARVSNLPVRARTMLGHRGVPH